MRTLHIPAYEFERQRWANQRGWTREICRFPAGSPDFDWRASIAEIDQPGDFSRFEGCRRQLTLLEGTLLELHVGAEAHALRPPYERIEFDGETAVSSALPEGPVRAFNLIYRPGRVRAETLLRPLVGPMVFFADPGQQWLLYLVRGECGLKQPARTFRMTAGDALLLGGEAGGDRRAIVDGGGEVLLVRIARAG